jgi:hypothetical protein
MGHFEVQILSRRIEAVMDSAEEAYRWLDQHAENGERYQINALPPEGGVVVVDADFYVRSTGRPPAA